MNERFRSSESVERAILEEKNVSIYTLRVINLCSWITLLMSKLKLEMI